MIENLSDIKDLKTMLQVNEIEEKRYIWVGLKANLPEIEYKVVKNNKTGDCYKIPTKELSVKPLLDEFNKLGDKITLEDANRIEDKRWRMVGGQGWRKDEVYGIEVTPYKFTVVEGTIGHRYPRKVFKISLEGITKILGISWLLHVSYDAFRNDLIKFGGDIDFETREKAEKVVENLNKEYARYLK